MDAQTAKNELMNQFGLPAEKIAVQRERRIFVDVEYENFLKVFAYSINTLKFDMLCTITGLDEGQKIALIYHLADTTGTMLNLRTSIPKDKPVLQTVMNYFPSAEIYERELTDLLGVQVKDLPEGKRYPLPDDWPAGEYPLRKDWKQKTSDEEAA